MYNLRLKELRVERNLSQSEVAKNIGIARQTYNHYEVKENIIPLKHLINLSNYYQVSIDYILGFNNTLNYGNKMKSKVDLVISGERLKDFRKENKLTQEKLAMILNTFHTVIVDYEHGKNLIATPFLYTICKKYNISADYLLGRIDNPKYLDK